MFTKKLLVLIGLALCYSGCSNYKDQQTIPPETLPASVIKVMSDAYPDATDATFQTIEKDALYEVFFKQKGEDFYAALNTRRILSIYRYYGDVPDSMRTALPTKTLTGGEAADYKEPMPQPYLEKTYNSKYIWNNREYLLTWYQYAPSNPIRYFLRIDPFTKFSYLITGDELMNLPKSIISFFDREKLRFPSVEVSFNEKNERQYFINATSASGTNYQFTFNQAGKLINTIYRAEAVYYEMDELPEKIQTFIKNSSAFTQMNIAEGYRFSDPAGTGYVISMQGMQENCSMNFDQDGNFVNMTYQTSIYR